MKNLFILLFVTFLFNSACAQSNATAGLKASSERGKVLYEQYCLACHQADGSGVPNLNPPLIKTKWVLGDKKELIKVLIKGMDEEIEVDGEVYRNVMPPFAYLSNKEIADVSTYIRNSFTNKGGVVTEEEVKIARSKLE